MFTPLKRSSDRPNFQARPATSGDAEAITRIYNEGIEDRVATFETRLHIPAEIRSWFDGAHPVGVVEADGHVVAFWATTVYRPRECYVGIAECSVYVARAWRGKGAGTLAVLSMINAAETAGFWKLVSRVFAENQASRAMLKKAGFREVGTYEKHARLDGVWRDVIIVERLIGTNIR